MNEYVWCGGVGDDGGGYAFREGGVGVVVEDDVRSKMCVHF